MIQSMTGYGRGAGSHNGVSVIVELRSVNSRYLELSSHLPRSLTLRENEIRDQMRNKIIRGKIFLTVTVQGEEDNALNLKVNTSAVRDYTKLLNKIRKTAKIRESLKLDHLLRFSEIIEGNTDEKEIDSEWHALESALHVAIEQLQKMRANEGGEIAKDLIARIQSLDSHIATIEQLSRERIPEERKRLTERIEILLGDKKIVDSQRLELEIVLLADKLDVTEECVRFRSHNKFFLDALKRDDGAGRKLNFLIQEMNREANTIGSKTSDSIIAHHVVNMKDELEKVREQLQNIE